MSKPGGELPSTKLLEMYFRAGLIQGAELVQAAIEQAAFELIARIKCRGIDVEVPKLHDVGASPSSSETSEAGERRSAPPAGRRVTSSTKGAR